MEKVRECPLASEPLRVIRTAVSFGPEAFTPFAVGGVLRGETTFDGMDGPLVPMALVAVKRSGFGDYIDLSLQEIQNATLEGAGPAAAGARALSQVTMWAYFFYF